MIGHDFHAEEGPKFEGLSEGQFRLGTEAFQNAAEELAFGPDPVARQQPVGALFSRFSAPSETGSIWPGTLHEPRGSGSNCGLHS